MFALIGIVLLLGYIFARLTCGRAKSSTCLAGKTAIVTGGNSGIGYEVCLNLASRGCRVIIADKDDSTRTREEIIEFTKNPNIVSKHLDLSKFKSIREFAADINQNEERLDILVNNAGIGDSTSLSTEDGFSPTMQVNYLGPFLLTHLLLGIKGESSALAFYGRLTPTTIGNIEKSSGSLATTARVYSNSKLATIMASDTFAEKLKGTGVTSNSLHPGIVRTKIFKTVKNLRPPLSLPLALWMYIYGKNSREGAQTTVHLAVSRKVENVSGKYFFDCAPFIKPAQANNAELCKKIWEISEEYVKLSPEEKIN
ncbi:retinol dehydrogenase 12-like [Asbolus verrucosus]|uniref:Retinol dehydrogenase 12-like n=1 Tax=Asbolus verrucosus TaxID=1661398 RepID=A0A482VWP2_ASBVE|nr:retinol dehydrogenase 12-like [Asbolus verrucosus]